MPQKSKLKLPPIDLGEETIGERLSRLRKERGLSQRQLAKKIGIIQSLISGYETGYRTPNIEMVARIAKALGVSTDKIIGLKSNGKQEFELNLKLMKKIYAIEKLSEYKQKIILSMIDSYLRDNLPKE